MMVFSLLNRDEKPTLVRRHVCETGCRPCLGWPPDDEAMYEATRSSSMAPSVYLACIRGALDMTGGEPRGPILDSREARQ